MAGPSEIEWTDATWNPVRGCTKVSPGCKHCYAETFAERFRGVPGHPYEQGFDLRLVPEQLEVPMHWRKPRMVFVNSMSDLFQEDVPDAYVLQVLEVIRRAANLHGHVFQVLTKRAERMRSFFSRLQWAGRFELSREEPDERPVAFVALRYASTFSALQCGLWLGVSVEDRKHGHPRIEALRATPARHRFLSIEPLLEELGPIDLRGIDQMIVGGESGQHARACNITWIRSVVEQADAQHVPVFVKQLGARPVGPGAPILLGRQNKGGNVAMWPADLAGRRELHAAWRAGA